MDAAIRTTPKELGRPDYAHPTGHGVGLRGIEMPYLGQRGRSSGQNNMHLEPGMVVTMEPTARDDKVGVFRMEDMFLVTDNRK